ncbi:hypothetical protein [Vibrio neptunius]|uniref:hypothetical protein n=1 Tax=Vibrio neptunius TaxID=170651 RepID=UPI001C5CAA89|nr:hypothetical protein [Vibrio neptunius]QXX09261.1 hypothetical protein KW548_19620 [Vibrio neptunius]
MTFEISNDVRKKLAVKHDVTEQEVIECFANRESTKNFLKDTREEHLTDPPTLWFVSETDTGKKLKVVFIYYSDLEKFVIKTAYAANPEEIRIFNKFA